MNYSLLWYIIIIRNIVIVVFFRIYFDVCKMYLYLEGEFKMNKKENVFEIL